MNCDRPPSYGRPPWRPRSIARFNLGVGGGFNMARTGAGVDTKESSARSLFRTDLLRSHKGWRVIRWTAGAGVLSIGLCTAGHHEAPAADLGPGERDHARTTLPHNSPDCSAVHITRRITNGPLRARSAGESCPTGPGRSRSAGESRPTGPCQLRFNGRS